MFPGSKRSREENSEGEGAIQETCPATFQHMSLELDEITKSVGSVNGAVLQSVVRKAQQLQRTLEGSRTSNAELWKQMSRCQANRVVTALSHARIADDSRQKTHSIGIMKEQLESSTALAVGELMKGFDSASKTTIALFSSQLEGEQQINEKLVERVQNLLRGALQALQVYSQRALDADLSALKKDVTIARLQSSLSFYQNASLRHHEEVLSLIDMVRILASKGKDADHVSSQLRQAKAHVRLLEKHLDLSGVVHAIVPPDFVPVQPGTEPPNPALQRTAPEYFALRLLQHRDVTLSELVDAWQRQESRIAEAEAKYVALKESVAVLRREALTVHEHFIEERRRREVVEHRLADLVRERIHPSGSELLSQQLTQLRMDYTRALDNSVQMATSLNMAREQLSDERAKCAELERTVQQLKDDSDAGKVVHTVAALRRYYEEEVSRLRNDTVNAETQCALAVAQAETQQRATREVEEALKITERTMTDVSSALQRVDSKRFDDKGRRHQGGSGVVQSGQLAAEVKDAVSRSEAHFQKAITSFEAMLNDKAAQREEDLRAFGQQVLRLIATFESLQSVASAANDGAENAAVVVDVTMERHQRDEIRSLLRETLAQTLHFLSNKLETTQMTETNLLDAAINDGQNVSVLLDKVREVTKERDLALERLARCEQLIDQHGLVAMDRVLMHEAPVDNSLDAVEASEQIAAMREQLTSLQAVRDAAMTELTALREEKQNISEDAEHTALQLKLLKNHNSDLLSSLQEHLTRETTLVEQLHRQQRQLQQIAADGEQSPPASNPEERVECMKGPLGQQLEELCSGFTAVKEQLVYLSETIPWNSGEKEAIESHLLRSGVRQVADTLRQALQRAELFRNSLQTETAALDVAEETEPLQGADTATEGEQGQLAALKEQLAAAMSAHESLIRGRDEELARLRAELAASASREESLRKGHEELQKQNADIQEKAMRLLHVNKQLVERVKTSRTEGESQSS